MNLSAPVVVAVHFKDGSDFLSRFGQDGGNDELFVPEALALGVGELIALDLYFDHSGYAFRVTGEIVSRRLTRAGNLPPGARIALTGDGEAPIRFMILAHARGQDIEYRPRNNNRVMCRFPVRLQRPILGKGEVVDLSPGGARIVGIAPSALGEELELRLQPPGSILGIVASGRVVWRRTAPDDAMGIEFRSDRPRLQRRIHELVDRLARRARELEPEARA